MNGIQDGKGRRLLNGRIPSLTINKLKKAYYYDKEQTIAKAVFNDIEAILCGIPKNTAAYFKKFRKPKVVGIDKLLLVIDDYESRSEVYNDFFGGTFFNLLKKAKFNTKVVVLGRDRLSDTHPCWNQHYEQNIKQEIELKYVQIGVCCA